MSIGAGVEIFLALHHAVDDPGGTGRVADAPARHGIGLGEAVDDDSTLLHALQSRNGAAGLSGIEEGVVHLVGNHQELHWTRA